MDFKHLLNALRFRGRVSMHQKKLAILIMVSRIVMKTNIEAPTTNFM